MPKTRISPRPEHAEELRASAEAYKELRNEIGEEFTPLQQEVIDKWLAWDKEISKQE
jgi:hypothetical protein